MRSEQKIISSKRDARQTRLFYPPNRTSHPDAHTPAKNYHKQIKERVEEEEERDGQRQANSYRKRPREGEQERERERISDCWRNTMRKWNTYRERNDYFMFLRMQTFIRASERERIFILLKE